MQQIVITKHYIDLCKDAPSKMVAASILKLIEFYGETNEMTYKEMRENLMNLWSVRTIQKNILWLINKGYVKKVKAETGHPMIHRWKYCFMPLAVYTKGE